MNLVGKILNNRYEILKQIGSGGMATVYKAKCQLLNRYVAIKVLRDEFTTDAEFIKRFNSEAQSAASLTHPNIVGIYDVGNEDNLYYIVMELIKGKTLKEIITTDGILPWKWSVNVAIQIASALEFAHKNNVVHRDIKPHNIIITEEGVAKVTDFGIARAISNSTITSFGSTMGSVHYFSPEHAKGGYTNAKSDIYSLGVVLYEMLTGKVPFEADTPVSIALKHMQEDAIEVKKLNPTVPASLNDIIKKAMQKDPNLRYDSAEEILEDLKETLKNPEGTFVKMNEKTDMDKTQRVNIIAPENNETKKENRSDPDEEKKGFFKRHKVLGIILGIIIVIAIFFGAIFGAYTIFSKKENQVQIPNLVGMTIDAATTVVNDAKLKIQESDERYDPTIPEGQIIEQDPGYQDNFSVIEGSTINVVVSKGQQMTTVPNVVGMIKDDAYKALQNANLNYTETDENSDTVQKDYVIKQDTDPDTEIPAGTAIVIHVSTGVQQVTVPDLSGKTEADAKKAISSANLKYKATLITNDPSKPNGVVVSQNISAGSTVDKNTEITITVNQFNAVQSANLIVDVATLTDYTAKTDADGNPVAAPQVTVKALVDGTAAATGVFAQDTSTAKLSITSNNSVATITIVIDLSGNEISRTSYASQTISGNINLP
ncbi:MAG: Stk1 family PASTA domain-containing Ser/Thr kinase [Oscillospiraceae bacterium]|nr:Stk1 family PASTA domain-containing Ser/Thr kinase [Oscillospiraceae bacterium]